MCVTTCRRKDASKLQFLPRDATQSAVRRLRVVCPSVTITYRDHIGWNSSKIISRPNSLRPVLSLTATWAIWCNGNTPKLGWNRGELELNYRGYMWADLIFISFKPIATRACSGRIHVVMVHVGF